MASEDYPETFKRISEELTKKDLKIQSNETKYKNAIANNLFNMAKVVFYICVVLSILFFGIFIFSLDESTELETFTDYILIFYGVLFGAIAPICKILLTAKAEQIELLTQINNKIK